MSSFKIKQYRGAYGVFAREAVKGMRGDVGKGRRKVKPMPIVGGMKRHEAIREKARLEKLTGHVA